MPLRDHFRPPVSKRSSWQGFHAMLPMAMVQQLAAALPDRFVGEPRVHLGTYREFGPDSEADDPVFSSVTPRNHAAPAPSLTVETEFPEEYAYEVLIFDLERDRRLVAAIEIVSPANKDRPDSRHLFVAKCANLLRKDVCVSIVDLVTVRRFNLYVELLTLMETRDPTFHPNPPPTYAATCRKATADGKTLLQTWSFPLAVGQPLPTALPVWLTDELNVMLDLEASYEATCRPLKIA